MHKVDFKQNKFDSKPSILIPLPNVSNDHQMYNAKVLENVGAAKIIKNDELNGEILNSEIEI